MTATIVALLQLALAVLTSVRGVSALPAETRNQALQAVSQAVAVATVAMSTSPRLIVEVLPTSNDWPTVEKLRAASYRTSDGNTVRLVDGIYSYPTSGSASDPGHFVRLMDSYTSFGDLNHDNFDDAVAILKTHTPDGAETYTLAAMVNRGGGVLSNVATVELGALANVTYHRVERAQYVIDLETAAGTRKTLKYHLAGNRLVAE